MSLRLFHEIFLQFMALFGLSWFGVGMFRLYALRKGILDKPNARSSHVINTPRGGGVIIVALWFGLLSYILYMLGMPRSFIVFFLPCLIGVTGFLDDLYSLSSLLRFIIQIAVGTAVVYILASFDVTFLEGKLPIWLMAGALIFGFTWFTNLFNFMDGIDGIASLEAIFVLILGGTFLYQVGALILAQALWGLSAIVFGFLFWNWPGAKIFMGDSGSSFLGAIIAVAAIASSALYHISLIPWLIITSLFWFDATITLLRRILRKEDWTKPHKNHAYQRLVQSGWTHQQVLWGVIAINSGLGVLAHWAFQSPDLAVSYLGLGVSCLTIVYMLVEMKRPMASSWHSI